MAKGGEFEREVCKDLSRWWTDDPERDDVFWRSSNSGGRATMRKKRGKKTYGHVGDVAAVDPIGKPFLDFMTVEIKRGYSKHTLSSLLDTPRHAAQQQWEGFIQQAEQARIDSGSRFWMIVAKRDQRIRFVVFPFEVFRTLGLRRADFRPLENISAKIRFFIKDSDGDYRVSSRSLRVSAVQWDSWIQNVSPDLIRGLSDG